MFDDIDINHTRLVFGLDDLVLEDLEAMLAVHTDRPAEGSMLLATALRKQIDLHLRFQARNIALLQVIEDKLAEEAYD